MRKHLASSVANQLTTIILATTAAVLLLTVLLLVIIEVISFRRELAANLVSTAGIIASNSRAAVLYKDYSNCEHILSSLSADPNIRLAYIFGQQGQPISRYVAAMEAEKAISQIRQGLAAHELLTARGGDGVEILSAGLHTSVAWPVLYEGGRIGTIFLWSDQQTLWQRLLWLCFGALLVFGGALLLAYLLAQRLQRRVSRPILALAEKMREVRTQSNFGARVELPGEDELKLLSAGFNDMLSTLAKRDAALAEHQQGLETLVVQRTAELQTSHDHLRSANEQLKESRREAEAANQAKSQFLAHMSHEIRTPLAGILGMAELLRDTPLDSEQQEMVGMVNASGEALLGILNDVLDLAKIEAGKLELHLAPFDLVAVAEGVARLFAGQAQSKGVELHCQIDAACRGSFQGDAGRLRQVLLNLLGNALKFTPAGTVLLRVRQLTAGADAECISFEVSDTGIGIADEAQRQIFESFCQEDHSTSQRFGGTGLGLAIVRNLLSLMGTDIALESTPGAGSRFSFILSLPRLATAEHADESARRQGCHLLPKTPRLSVSPGTSLLTRDITAPGKGRILLAEDNSTIQQVIQLTLRNHGFEISIAGNGREALAMLAEEEFDLVLMDVEMPEMDGLQATQALRAAGCEIPIIALSAHLSREHARRCLVAGMDDYLSKPYRQGDLLRIIEQWLVNKAIRAV